MRKLIALAALVLMLLVPSAASAHPLGNFTTNRYSQIELSGDRVYVLYVLDMAEIPTYQERARVRASGQDGYARQLASEILSNLELRVDGVRVPLGIRGQVIGFPPGVAGLRTMRFEVVFASPPLTGSTAPRALEYRDANYSNRVGWKEVVLRAGEGAELLNSNVPGQTISQELRSYPNDLLSSPPDVTVAEAAFAPGEGEGVPPALSGAEGLDDRVTTRNTADGGFASLIARQDLGLGVVLLSLLVAMFWGAAHALSPGHGKAIVAAYLVGARGTPRQALYLGLIVTLTHTAGVFALGLVTLALSEFLVPEQLYPWLNLVAALLVVGVGISVVRSRVSGFLAVRRGAYRGVAGRPPDGHGHDHGHHHEHGHGHRHGHDHAQNQAHDHEDGHGPEAACGCRHHAVPESGMGWRGLVGVGVSGGIIPCPSALVVLLAAISLQRVGYGLVLILAFSIGLAAAISGIGLVAISARRLLSRFSFDGQLVRLLPAVSALAILGFGIAMTVRAVPGVA